MNYYNEIKNKLVDNEIYSKVKDYSKEKHKVITYYEIGKLLSEARSAYGESIIEKYANRLVVEVGKKYNYRTLYRMRKFYQVFSDEKLTTLLSKLSWSHYLLVISIENTYEIEYYINICIKQNLSVRDLEKKIKSKEYERLDENTKNKLINKEEEKEIDSELLVKINKLIEERNNAKKNKDYALADKIRDELKDMNVVIKDTREGTTFEIL